MIHIALLALVIQTPPPAGSAPPPQPAPIDCQDTEHSAFNFWLGDWNVSPTNTATVIATSTISPAAGGCAIEEDFRQFIGPGGVAANYQGASFSVFDAAGGGKWRQFYVDSGGSVTVFEGGLQDGAMVLDAPAAPGIIQRMTIAPQPDGSVRQWGRNSRDGGASWSANTYDFTYRRR